MDQNTNLGTLVADTVRVGLPCHCGCDSFAVHPMSVDEARQYATSVLAACDNFPTGVFPTMGGDS